jgi:hypothetical protein
MDAPRCPHCRATLGPEDVGGIMCPWCGRKFPVVPPGPPAAPTGDWSFSRAVIVGAVVFAFFLAAARAWDADAEFLGRMTAYFLLPAVLVGVVARGRGWGWPVIAGLYLVLLGIVNVLIFSSSRNR